jgi:hypothetical protein
MEYFCGTASTDVETNMVVVVLGGDRKEER